MQAQMIKAYVDQTFEKYDTDKSGTLDEKELTFFFNDLFKTLGMKDTVTKQQSLEAIKSIDQNSDGSVDKQELFEAFMKMISASQPQSQPMTQSYPPSAPGYPLYQGNYSNPNMSVSYPHPPQNPPPGYNGYSHSPCNEYGMQNPYLKSPNYYPQPQYNPNYPQHPQYPQYSQYPQYPQYQPHYPQPNYQHPNQPPYQASYQGGYPPSTSNNPNQPPYQASYQGGYPPSTSNNPNQHSNNNKGNFDGSQGGNWGGKK